jgi:hypothetical protein
MRLSEVFDDPLDPVRSLQLNNKYWPGEKYTLLGLIAEAEAAVGAGELVAAARLLRPLERWFTAGGSYARFLRRLHRVHLFRSGFGCAVGKVSLPGVAIEANRYGGSGTRASYPLKRAEMFASLSDRTASTYARAYGTDLIKVNKLIRYAVPDERQADVTDYGVLSDYHNDEYKGITTIVYLCDVTEENGAFSFIRDSERIRRSLVLTAIHQAVHFDMQRSTAEQLAPLPLEFRGSTGIGNLLEPDKAAMLHEHCEIVAGEPGTFVTFNGQYLLHRGGKPVSGSRLAAFFQPEGILRHKLQSVRSVAFGRAYGSPAGRS